MLHQRYLSNTIVLAFCITGLILTGCEDGVLDSTDEPDALTFQERPEPGSIPQDQISSLPAEKNSHLAKLRNATAHFNNFSKAEEAGYGTRIWIWRHNPSGMFFDWNPKVSCEHADEAFDVAHAGDE